MQNKIEQRYPYTRAMMWCDVMWCYVILFALKWNEMKWTVQCFACSECGNAKQNWTALSLYTSNDVMLCDVIWCDVICTEIKWTLRCQIRSPAPLAAHRDKHCASQETTSRSSASALRSSIVCSWSYSWALRDSSEMIYFAAYCAEHTAASFIACFSFRGTVSRSSWLRRHLSLPLLFGIQASAADRIAVHCEPRAM